MRIAVLGTTDVEYSTAWHYAAAFEGLSCEVERQVAETSDLGLVGLNIDGCAVGVRVGRLAGLDRRYDSLPAGVEHFFTDDGVWVNEQASGSVHYLRSGCHGPEAHESEAYPPWEPLWDVGFIGSSPGHLEWPHRAELVAHLREWFGDRFCHVGPGGQQVEDDSRNLWGFEDRPLRGHWLNRWYRSVPIVIGDTVGHDPTAAYWSERVYETWARGGFLIHPGNDLLAAEFGSYPGDQWQPGDWATLHATIRYWLDRPDARRWEAKMRQDQMRVQHTYDHRCIELLLMLGAT